MASKMSEFVEALSPENLDLAGYDRVLKANRRIDAALLGGGDLSVYDKVIRTQEEFENLIANPTWLDAVSVALVGEFTADAGIVIPATVKQIHGFNGAKITVTATVSSDISLKGLSYATRPDYAKGYEVRNLEVAFTITDTGSNEINGDCFSKCTNLTNCTGTSTIESSNSYSTGWGISLCTNLINCTGTGIGYIGYGFNACTNLTDCTGTGESTGEEGFGSGYSFRNCSYCKGCKSGTTPSTTGIWDGTNLKRDDDSCELD